MWASCIALTEAWWPTQSKALNPGILLPFEQVWPFHASQAEGGDLDKVTDFSLHPLPSTLEPGESKRGAPGPL